MNLLEVRTLLVKQSGRYDLVVSGTSFQNNEEGFGGGADAYLKTAQKWLDQKVSAPLNEFELSVSLATGAFTTSLANVRAVKAVAVVDSVDGTMRYLPRKTPQAIRSAYGDENGSLAGVDRGEPNVWCLGFASSPTTPAVKLITMPPTDRAYELKVEALKYSSALSNDTSESFWTVQYPQVLIWAALYFLEVSYRNSQGARVWLAHIQEFLDNIDNDLVEQEIIGTDVPNTTFQWIEPPRRSIERIVG